MIDKIFPFFDFLYLLQLEEYDTKRYLKLISRFFLKRGFQKRQKLVLTSRVRVTLALSVVLTILGSYLTIIFTVLLIPFWVALANIVLNPIYERIKHGIQKSAAKHFANKYNGKVIAVAGSFGKTTTKNYIYELVRYNFKTQMIPGNINTPTGIAAWILKNLNTTTEILIVEMDTYFIGEIKRSCAITPPDIAILTNVGDQHLERFGSKAKLKIALHEVFNYAKAGAIKISDKESNLEYALAVAKALKIPKDIVDDTAKKLAKPDRRGNIIDLHGFETIDESYNISFTTAKFTLKNALLLAKQMKKKLIVVTAGIPELGRENKDANFEYGKILAESKAQVVLCKTVLHNEVLEGISQEVLLAEGMTDAWEIIKKNFSPKEYLVLMQPELGDNYY